MLFILVNDRRPLGSSACARCRKPLDVGYLKEIAAHRLYCNYRCYQQRKAGHAGFAHPGPDAWSTARPSHLGGLYFSPTSSTDPQLEPLRPR
jgi:hypothetical protein